MGICILAIGVVPQRGRPQGPPPRIHILPRPYGNEGDFRKPTSENPGGRSPWLKGNVLRLDSGNVQVYLILSNYTFLV
jgi:hypothetical protein